MSALLPMLSALSVLGGPPLLSLHGSGAYSSAASLLHPFAMMDDLFFGSSFSPLPSFSPFSPFFGPYRPHTQYFTMTRPSTAFLPTKEMTVDLGPDGVWKFPPPRPATPPPDASTAAHQATHRAAVEWHDADKDFATSLGTLRSTLPSGGLTEIFKANIPENHNETHHMAKRAVTALTTAAKSHASLADHIGAEAASALKSMASGTPLSGSEDASKGYWHHRMINRHLDRTRNRKVPDAAESLMLPHTQSMALSLMLKDMADLAPELRSLMESANEDDAEERKTMIRKATTLHAALKAAIQLAISEDVKPWQEAESSSAIASEGSSTVAVSQPDTVPIGDDAATVPEQKGWMPNGPIPSVA